MIILEPRTRLYTLSSELWALCFVGSSEHHSTMCLEEHNVLRSASNGFCVFDSRGLDYEKMVESFDGLFQWMEDGVRHHQECRREGDEDEPNGEPSGLCWFESSKYAKRRVNCVFVVANMAEICGAVKDGNKKPLEATKSLFTCPAINKCSNISLISLSSISFNFFFFFFG